MKAVTVLSFLTNNIKNSINKFSTLRVMTFRPVITSTGLTKHDVVGTEYLTIRSGFNAVHRTRLEIHENGTRNVPPARSLVVINIDTLELEIGGVAVVTSGGINAVLVADDFPELGTDLVPALPALDVEDLSHGVIGGRFWWRERCER